MHLGEYLKTNKITQEEFLRKMEATTGKSISQGGLSKYIQGKRVPKKEVMMMIYERLLLRSILIKVVVFAFIKRFKAILSKIVLKLSFTNLPV